jgi:hypothetical protein
MAEWNWSLVAVDVRAILDTAKAVGGASNPSAGKVVHGGKTKFAH